jgi:hypothetical protein
MKEDGRKMEYNAVRKACVDTMKMAGIRDQRGYHLKAAAITELQSHGVSAENIAAFARHKPGSTMWASHYWDAKNSADSVKRLVGLK